MGEGIVGEFGVSMYTLLYLKQIISKDLHSSGNSVQCYVAPCIEGSLGENGYMHIYGWMPLLFTWKYHNIVIWFSSVQFSRSVVTDSLQPHESQHARPPCPSPTPGVHSDSRPSSQWCHPAISSSVVAFSSCPQSLPTSESFPMSQLFDIPIKILTYKKY